MSNNLKWLIRVAIGFAIFGFFCMFFFILILSKYYHISVSNDNIPIDMPVTGQVGDFIGGVVGTVWTFSTVIFLYVSLRVQDNQISEQNIKWETQRVEDIYFKLIENYNSIAFVLSPGERSQILTGYSLHIKDVLMGKSTIEEYKKTINDVFFSKNQDETLWRISESLLFIVKFLYQSGREEILIRHLEATLPAHEKSLLFYYLLAKPYKFDGLPRSKYLQSGLVQDANISYDVLRTFAPDLFPPLNPKDFDIVT